MIDISKIKVESEEVDHRKFKHVASLEVHGVMFSDDNTQNHIDAAQRAKLLLWLNVYGDLDDLVRDIVIAGQRAACLISPVFTEATDELRDAVQALSKRIQYPHEPTVPVRN